MGFGGGSPQCRTALPERQRPFGVGGSPGGGTAQIHGSLLRHRDSPPPQPPPAEPHRAATVRPPHGPPPPLSPPPRFRTPSRGFAGGFSRGGEGGEFLSAPIPKRGIREGAGRGEATPIWEAGPKRSGRGLSARHRFWLEETAKRAWLGLEAWLPGGWARFGEERGVA